MLKIKTTDIAAGAAMPLKSGSLYWLQRAIQFNDWFIVNALTNSNLPANPIILWGCVETISGTTHTITDGALILGNEIYYVNAATITLGVGQVVVGTITTEYYTGVNADPVTFSNGIQHNVHESRTITLSANTSGSSTFNFANVSYFNDTWHEVGATGQPAYIAPFSANSLNSNGALQYKVDIAKKRVYFRGSFGCTYNSTTQNVFTFPFSFVQEKCAGIIILVNSIATIGIIGVNALEKLYVNPTNISDGDTVLITMDGVSFEFD